MGLDRVAAHSLVGGEFFVRHAETRKGPPPHDMRTYAWIQHRHTHDRDSANVLSRRRSQPGVTSAIVRSLRHVTSPRRHAARVGRVGRVEAELLAMASRPNSGMKVEGEIRLSLTLLNIVRARDEPGLAVPMKI